MVLSDLQPGQWRELTAQEVLQIVQGMESGGRSRRTVTRQ